MKISRLLIPIATRTLKIKDETPAVVEVEEDEEEAKVEINEGGAKSKASFFLSFSLFFFSWENEGEKYFRKRNAKEFFSLDALHRGLFFVFVYENVLLSYSRRKAFEIQSKSYLF